MLSIGAARGALHIKTEGSVYNLYILPTGNVAELKGEDISFTPQGLVKEK